MTFARTTTVGKEPLANRPGNHYGLIGDDRGRTLSLHDDAPPGLLCLALTRRDGEWLACRLDVAQARALVTALGLYLNDHDKTPQNTQRTEHETQ